MPQAAAAAARNLSSGNVLPRAAATALLAIGSALSALQVREGAAVCNCLRDTHCLKAEAMSSVESGSCRREGTGQRCGTVERYTTTISCCINFSSASAARCIRCLFSSVAGEWHVPATLRAAETGTLSLKRRQLQRTCGLFLKKKLEEEEEWTSRLMEHDE